MGLTLDGSGTRVDAPLFSSESNDGLYFSFQFVSGKCPKTYEALISTDLMGVQEPTISMFLNDVLYCGILDSDTEKM